MSTSLESLRALTAKMEKQAEEVHMFTTHVLTAVDPYPGEVVGRAQLVRHPKNGQWVYININPELAALNGGTVHDHLLKSVDERWPLLAESVNELLERVRQGEDLIDLRFSAPTDGDHRDWLVTYFGLKASDGTVIAISALVRVVPKEDPGVGVER